VYGNTSESGNSLEKEVGEKLNLMGRGHFWLISPLFFRQRGAGQVDFVIQKKNSLIIYEVKREGDYLTKFQRGRLLKSARLLACLSGMNVTIEYVDAEFLEYNSIKYL
jgi:hypothetical protein